MIYEEKVLTNMNYIVYIRLYYKLYNEIFRTKSILRLIVISQLIRKNENVSVFGDFIIKNYLFTYCERK